MSSDLPIALIHRRAVRISGRKVSRLRMLCSSIHCDISTSSLTPPSLFTVFLHTTSTFLDQPTSSPYTLGTVFDADLHSIISNSSIQTRCRPTTTIRRHWRPDMHLLVRIPKTSLAAHKLHLGTVELFEDKLC